MEHFDQSLFLALNFDGGSTWDHIMLTLSGTWMWVPLYALILWLVWRQYGAKKLLIFTLLMIAAIVLSDMICGIFKQNGVLGNLMPNFHPRTRPMYTPELEHLSITPDSLAALRREGVPMNWTVHAPMGALGGRYGTVSAHMATIVAVATLSIAAIRRYWFTLVMILSALAIGYSRIYLGKHFPTDLLWGALIGLALGWVAWLIFRRTTRTQ